MKKISLILSVFFLFGNIATAQKDVRTTGTRIADILAQMPAKNETDLNTAMKEMELLGVEGLHELSKRLAPDGTSDNSKIEYAIMGYTGYVSKPGREVLKKDAEEAWIKALSNTKDKNLTSFFMDMLGIIGSDKSVPALLPYLKDKMLGDKAIPVLASIGTTAAGSGLLRGLTEQGANKTGLIQALGYMKYAPALNQLNRFATDGTKEEQKAAGHSIAQIGDPASADLLLELTVKNGIPFSNGDAVADYGFYIQRLKENGHEANAANLASTFFKNSANSNTYARIAALKALTLVLKEKALPELAKAAYDTNPEYRRAALDMADALVNESNISIFTKGFKRATPDVQISLMGFLSDHPEPSVYKTIINLAQKSKNPDLKQAAITAIGRLSMPGATQSLLTLVQKSSDTDLPALKEALLLVKDGNLTNSVLSALLNTSGPGKAMLIEVLAAKREKKAFDLIAREFTSSDIEVVKEAALQALPLVSSNQHLQQLLDMLFASKNANEISVIQNAITSALKGAQGAENIILGRLDKTAADSRHLLFPALSFIGNNNALKKVFSSYKNNAGDRVQALKTIAAWPNAGAMDALYSIASKMEVPNSDKIIAAGGFIRLIPETHAPADQQLLLLKKAMAIAGTDEQSGEIIDQAGRMNTFTALAFVADYLENPTLKQKAANAVMNIGMSDKSFYGTLVREWLTKAKDIISGRDDIYMKKAIEKFLADMPKDEGYVSVFNGKDLTGWKGLVANPIERAKMTSEQIAEAQKKADEVMRSGWTVKNGELLFLGKGDNIATVKKYGDFEMLIDWKIFNDGQKDGDAGIYLRGTPQVQIWDTSRRDVGAEVGSGGLYNNQKYRSTPLKVADNPLGDWNHFYIKMVGDKVTVYLNGELVTDNIPLENYWDRNMPLWSEEQIELQAHGSRIGYRDIYIKELGKTKPFELSEEEKQQGYEVLFDGTNMDNWQGNLTDYVVKNGEMVIEPQPGSRGNLYTKKEYGDFSFRFEFKLTPGANNGVGIRTPMEGDAAYVGMEIQILDNTADIYKNLHEYQYHGSVYGVIPAKRGFLKPVGEWNYEEIIAKGDSVTVILNGKTIVNGNIREASKNGTIDGQEHPGLLNKKGYIGFLGHGSVVHFRNIRVKELK